MRTYDKPRDLNSLRESVSEDPRRVHYLIRLEMLRNQIERECPQAVHSATAFGKFLELFEEPAKQRPRMPRDGLEILVVTTLKNLYQAHELLGEKVFGPILLEFANLPVYHVWTISELETARETKHELWRRVQREGVTIYGRPLASDDGALKGLP